MLSPLLPLKVKDVSMLYSKMKLNLMSVNLFFLYFFVIGLGSEQCG